MHIDPAPSACACMLVSVVYNLLLSLVTKLVSLATAVRLWDCFVSLHNQHLRTTYPPPLPLSFLVSARDARMHSSTVCMAPRFSRVAVMNCRDLELLKKNVSCWHQIESRRPRS